jgi:hypothetical protein
MTSSPPGCIRLGILLRTRQASATRRALGLNRLIQPHEVAARVEQPVARLRELARRIPSGALDPGDDRLVHMRVAADDAGSHVRCHPMPAQLEAEAVMR